jgi:hypothetical protein
MLRGRRRISRKTSDEKLNIRCGIASIQVFRIQCHKRFSSGLQLVAGTVSRTQEGYVPPLFPLARGGSLWDWRDVAKRIIIPYAIVSLINGNMVYYGSGGKAIVVV